MNHKVLLADDSLTIQKVIKITLANQPYEITEASSEDELFQKLSALKPKLVFLDFNLSDKHTGYELTSRIKKESPATKVLLLLGTFDTVDDGSMEKCGASDKIIKPFDSNKFISICRRLVEEFEEVSEIPFPAGPKKESGLSEVSSDDQWTMAHPTEQSFPTQESGVQKPLEKVKNPLLQEVTDWGMSIPSIIGSQETQAPLFELPPIIGASKATKHAPEKAGPESQHSQKYPQSDDLDYPSVENPPQPKATTTAAKTASKLISIEGLNEPAQEIELQGNFVPDESDVKSIEAQIHDEIQEDLWVADEFESLKKEVSIKIEEAKVNFQPTRDDFDESLFRPIDDSESITWHDSAQASRPAAVEPRNESFFGNQTPSVQAPDMTEFRTEMEVMVKKYVREYLDQMFQKNTEKVAWEVIPDLAENIIRQELTKISKKILSDQG
jgi:CheY-like chemotaxis protein